MEWLRSLSHRFYEWTLHWAATPHAEIGLFGIAFMESSFFPIPPDALLIAMCLSNPQAAFKYALICTIGSVLGGLAGYGVGYWGGRPILRKIVSVDKILLVERLFQQYSAGIILIAGFTPIPYKLFTIGGGAFRINLATFFLASSVGRASRFFMVAAVFYFWGETMKVWIERYFNILTIMFVVILVGGFFAMNLLKRKRVFQPVKHIDPD